MKFYFSMFTLTLMLAISFPLYSQQFLRTSYYSQNVAPQLFFDEQGRPISGILFDITHTIANQLDMQLEMLPIPRKRVEQSLETNVIDMHCVANPMWYKSIYLQWSDVIYNNPDILINRRGITALTKLSEYKKLKIGTTLGYIYPELSSYIDNENILPIPSLTPAASYKKYRQNKISGFVSASIEASYFYKNIEDSVIAMNDNEIHCALSPSLDKVTVNNINAVISTLKVTGEIDNILEKYRRIPESKLDRIQTLSD
ncbi:substrate-binding periplasmic protein [Cognaticolwellia beringensis]|uniref:Solute-binding protein family 3/N-terminal domain-containing protein n=1 Tax=Cognaticolwellia beringensis TaxID=1967665 RepID=A0A222GAD0_9GAMM|nr:transporter substrate-binding domain-containing protein [Cognaticolwellia beringensis]ASP48672.1 hypothetical protein B5D82_13370 [Cognaticolwellia beringensis]